MVAPLDHDRALLIEALWRATDELATSAPMLAEATVLRTRIHDLMAKLETTAGTTQHGADAGTLST
jgi:hypothetical protein